MGRRLRKPAKTCGKSIGAPPNEAMWDRAIATLLVTPVLQDAAKILGIQPETLRVWRRNPAFTTRFMEARDEVLGHALATIGAEYGASIETLKHLRENSKVDVARYMAAAKLIDMADRQIENERMFARIERLVEEKRELEALVRDLGGESRLRELPA